LAEPGTPEESGNSGSDFEETRKRKKAQRKPGQGPPTDTEAEDAALDRELEGAAAESDNPSLRRKRQKKKGKQRMITTQTGPTPPSHDADGQDAEDGADVWVDIEELLDDNEDPSDVDWKCVSGPLPQAARDEAEKLGRYVVKQANRIGRKHFKSRREIMLAAGLSVRQARPDSLINTYRRWYAVHHPNEAKRTY
jgi:hypothetical protein